MRLKPGTFRYRHTVSVNGRESILESTITIEETAGTDGWSLNPGNPIFTTTQTVVLEKKFNVRSSPSAAGPVQFELD